MKFQLSEVEIKKALTEYVNKNLFKVSFEYTFNFINTRNEGTIVEMETVEPESKPISDNTVRTRLGTDYLKDKPETEEVVEETPKPKRGILGSVKSIDKKERAKPEEEVNPSLFGTTSKEVETTEDLPDQQDEEPKFDNDDDVPFDTDSEEEVKEQAPKKSLF